MSRLVRLVSIALLVCVPNAARADGPIVRYDVMRGSVVCESGPLSGLHFVDRQEALWAAELEQAMAAKAPARLIAAGARDSLRVVMAPSLSERRATIALLIFERRGLLPDRFLEDVGLSLEAFSRYREERPKVPETAASLGATGAAGSSGASTYTPSGGDVHVRGYTRKDGTYVRPHTRSRPRRGR